MSGHKTLADWLLDALIEAGTWMNRAELAAVRECSDLALEDALSDLVVAGQVTFRENVGYRLSATNVCRRAAQLQRRERKRLAVVGVEHKDGYRLGFAEQREGLGLVMYEMALPNAAPGEDGIELRMKQLGAVVEFVNEAGGSCV
jgi:hypothetical protein